MQVAANQRTYHSGVAAYSAALDDDDVLEALTRGMKERQNKTKALEHSANTSGWGKDDGSAGNKSTTLLTAQLKVHRDGTSVVGAPPADATNRPLDRRPGKQGSAARR